MKKSVIGILLILVIFTTICCGCGRTKSEEVKESIKIGITMYDEFDPFTNLIADNIQSTLKELEGEQGITVTCETVFSSKSQLLQNDQVESFINRGFDVICVNLVDRTDAMLIIDKAKSANIPIIFFNRELVQDDLERWDKLYYVGAIPELSGRLQAELVTDALSNPERFKEIDFNHDGVIQYVVLEGEAGHQDALIRTKESFEGIRQAGFKVEKLGDEIANWNREQAETKMSSILDGYPWQIELVLANDDNMALGALDALEKYNVPKLPLIIGVNGHKEALEKIQKGQIEGTVYNNGYAKGRDIGKMAFSLAVTGEIPREIYLYNGKYHFVPYEKINASNVDNYIDKSVDK